MKRTLVLAFVFGSAGVASAFSFVGSDWELSYDLVYQVRTALGSDDIPETMTGSPVSVSQSVADAFSFPYSIGVIEGSGDFSVSGTTVTDTNGGKTTDPFLFLFNGDPVTVRLTYDDWDLVGEVTGSNAGKSDSFGPRAYEITGSPVTISDVQIEALLNGNWTDLGSDSSVVVNSWSMQRPVPEPLTLVGLGLAMAGMVRRRRA